MISSTQKSIILVINFIFIGGLGVILGIRPDILFQESSNNLIAMTRTFGFSAITFGILSFLMVFKYKASASHKIGFITLATFHWCILIATIMNLLEALVPFVIAIIHGVFAIIFTYLAKNQVYK